MSTVDKIREIHRVLHIQKVNLDGFKVAELTADLEKLSLQLCQEHEALKSKYEAAVLSVGNLCDNGNYHAGLRRAAEIVELCKDRRAMVSTPVLALDDAKEDILKEADHE